MSTADQTADPVPAAVAGSPSTGMLLIISGPSGVGKTTITHAVERAFPDACFSVSATTRTRTSQDRDGVDYHFISDAMFDEMVRDGAFLEHAGVFGKRYGTPRKWVEDQLAIGRLVILEIDVQGAQSVKKLRPDAYGLFVLPPSEQELLTRLRSRGRDDEGAIQRRFSAAQQEIWVAQQCNAYDCFLVNRDLNEAIASAIALVRAVRQTRSVAARV
ncbi:MAG: guanylate kinase [Planctomycetaceae bacterium]|jgi:guanylate kinase|nr:guanylate kinase [Phycisphaerales bacterium]MCE2652374.1 guanylate kinase [Planctomycetaceae bacterium]